MTAMNATSPPFDARGQLGQQVERLVEQHDVEGALQPLADRLDVAGEGQAQHDAEQRAEAADRQAVEQEDAA